MQRLLGIRIVRWELKLAYIVGAFAVNWAIAALLRAFGTADSAVLLSTVVVDVAALLFGARIFRGRGEPIEPPRPWWRMTARPTLSRRLGILFTVVAAGFVLSLLLTAVGLYEPPPQTSMGTTVASFVAGLLEYGAFSYLYLNSAVRLKRMGVPSKAPKPPKPPKFRSTVKLS